MDKSKLIKFLELTASSNDGEALSAIRKANIFLKENKLNWIDFIKEKPAEHKITSLTIHTSPKVEKMFDNMYNSAERAYSQELEKDINGFKNLIYFLIIVIIVLFIIIFYIW